MIEIIKRSTNRLPPSRTHFKKNRLTLPKNCVTVTTIPLKSKSQTLPIPCSVADLRSSP